MGIGSLRRYHKPVEQAEAPDVAPGITDTPAEADAAAEANAQQIADEQQQQADAANADETGAQSVAPIIQEAGGVEDNPAEPEPPTVPVTDEPSDAAGDVSVVTADDLSVAEPVDLSPEAKAEQEQADAARQERANEEAATARREMAEAAGLHRNSSAADWREFAKGQGVEAADEISRDDLALRYLGPKTD